MSPIGRIFIVLNLGLAAAFLGWASNAVATTDDYKAMYEAEQAAHQATADEKDGEIADLNVTINSLSDQNRSAQEEQRNLAERADSLKTQLDQEMRANEQMRGSLAQIEATLNDYNDTISRLSSEKDAAVAAKQEAENERDDAVAAAQDSEQAKRDAEDAKRTADQAIADLEAEKSDLLAQVSSYDTRWQMAKEKFGINEQDIISAPKIDAQVLDVRLDLSPGLVMLNVGKNKDVKRGYTFEIWRGGIYKGQVRVADVQDNVCSALVLNAVAGQTIAQGDQASTML